MCKWIFVSVTNAFEKGVVGSLEHFRDEKRENVSTIYSVLKHLSHLMSWTGKHIWDKYWLEKFDVFRPNKKICQECD